MRTSYSTVSNFLFYSSLPVPIISQSRGCIESQTETETRLDRTEKKSEAVYIRSDGAN